MLTGYTDWPSYTAGARVLLHLSGDGEAELSLVRLRHGDISADGPGLVVEPVHAPRQNVSLAPQPLPLGSYVHCPALDLDAGAEAWSFTAWVFPTAWPRRAGTVFATEHAGSSAVVSIGQSGELAFERWGGTNEHPGRPARITGPLLTRRTWQLVALVVDPAGGDVELVVHGSGFGASRSAALPVAPAGEAQRAAACQDAGEAPLEPAGRVEPLLRAGSTLVLGARLADGMPLDALDAKLEQPHFWSQPLGPPQLAALAGDRALPVEPLLALDFARRQQSLSVEDASGTVRGRVVNLPTRAVTGHRFDGRCDDWRDDPQVYGAMHFHSDDLADARWPVTASLELPAALESGVYAAMLEQRSGERDFVPFVVRPAPPPASAPPASAPETSAQLASAASSSAPAASPRSTADARRLVVLLPTFTYLAYADEPVFEPHVAKTRSPGDDWCAQQGLLSQYNWHRDGSGVVWASWLRPLLNLRPDYRYWLTGHPHGLGADLYLLDWLDHAGFSYDVITDHDVHGSGALLLEPYSVLLTGAHPEYWTRPGVEALVAFLGRGGRLFYAGGNGFGAYVGVHPELPEATELRRLAPARGLWDSDPGEARLASTGELGGHGRNHHPRGRELTGVDIAGMGFGPAAAYRRTPASRDRRIAFAFDGVQGETIGEFGLHLGGAAGYEVDAVDYEAATPAHALVVATTDDRLADLDAMDPRVPPRADMTFFETPSGGAVFSVSSITWSGSLSHNDYRNDVSTITANVLRRFLDSEPFLRPAALG